VAFSLGRPYLLDVALPIEPTPPFEGQDAVQLLEALDSVHLSDAEMARRIELAKANLAEAMRPKGYRTSAACQQRASTAPDSK
jgi:hypothetical protein